MEQDARKGGAAKLVFAAPPLCEEVGLGKGT